METIGLNDKLLDVCNQEKEAYDILSQSQELKAYHTVHRVKLAALKRLEKERSPAATLQGERTLLFRTLTDFANSPEERSSLKLAISQLDEAREAFQLVQKPEAYKAASQTYASKNKEAGLPLDAFRVFIKSHTTRLHNQLKATVSVEEKNILRQRQENLRAANAIYKEMQREALGMSKEMGQGLSI